MISEGRAVFSTILKDSGGITETFMKIQRDDYRLINITKERLAISKIEKALEGFSMVILSGPRKVGKTIAMLQIWRRR